MKTGRIVWAALMIGAAVAASAAATAAEGPAGGGAFPAAEIFPAAALSGVSAPIETARVPETEKPAGPARLVAVRAEALAVGTPVRALDADGTELCAAAVDGGGECALRLPAGGTYTLRAGALEASFTLEENASLSGVGGDGWTDGEILYLTDAPLCTLTVLSDRAGDGSLEVTLRGEGTEERRFLSAETGDRAVFAGLKPGEYTLEAGGAKRAVTLGAKMPFVMLGLD